ncbi:MAG: hypothetical protein ACLUJG_06385 [Lawsonibacter sp.]
MDSPDQRPGPVLHHPGGALRPEPHFSGGFSPCSRQPTSPAWERDGGPAAGRRAGPGVLTAAACWEGQPGNPVLFSAALLPELEALTGDQGDGWCCAATGTAVSFSRQRTLWSWLMRILQRRCWPSGRENRTP